MSIGLQNYIIYEHPLCSRTPLIEGSVVYIIQCGRTSGLANYVTIVL